jgi:hypothetical protein
LLGELRERGKVDGVRLAALLQSATESAGTPRYTAWVIVSAALDFEAWAEWRLLVGRQRAELTEHGFRVPERLAALTQERLEEVRGWIDAAGLVVREGVLAADGEAFEGRLE